MQHSCAINILELSVDKNMENIKVIAHIYTDFNEKFGIPRQSGIVWQSKGRIIFEPEYRNKDALDGLDGYSHLWLIWKFSENVRDEWSPTVRPPRLGGNKRVGVFATRSPFRPNPMGLSCVKLEQVILDSPEGPQLIVSGVDMLSGTPVYDIKPYLSYTDSHTDAVCGFADDVKDYRLDVHIPDRVACMFTDSFLREIIELLAQDPRPGYRHTQVNFDEKRIYGMSYAGYNIKFTVSGKILTVISCEK